MYRMEGETMITQYWDEITRLLQKVKQTQQPQMEQAAQMMADATLGGHNLFVFGCNHAGLLALEMYYRTGGMVNINPVRGPGLHLEINPATMTSQMERLNGYGRLLMDMTPIGKGDVIIIHSVSGRNAVSVDAAIRAREKGASVIVLTNMATSTAVESRHESGKKLYETADIVIDNCGCRGDAAIPLPGASTRIGPTSTVIGAAILNAVMCRAVELITAAGQEAPVFMSANADGGDAYNEKILKKYAEHIFYM